MPDLLELLRNRFGIAAKRAGNYRGGPEYHSACPQVGCCGTDGFHVWPEQGERGTFWCRGCNAAGDDIEFLMRYCGMTFRDAAILQDLPLSGPKTVYVPREPVARTLPRNAEAQARDGESHSAEALDAALWRQKVGAFAERCHAALLARPTALEWLLKRGVELADVKEFRLGFHGGKDDEYNPAIRPRAAYGLRDAEYDGKVSRHFSIPAGIVIPWFCSTGEVARLRIRCMRPDAPMKYKTFPGSAGGTYVVDPQARAFAVVETELDGIMIARRSGGLVGAVAMGSSHTKPTADAVSALGNALSILVAHDADTAGAGGAAWWLANYPRTRRWPVPRGKDPGEYFASGGDIRAWILAGLPPVFQVAQVTEVVGEQKSTASATANDSHKDDTDLALEELCAILAKHPVRVNRDSRGGMGIDCADGGWAIRNPATARRLSYLVFGPAGGFLASHPDDVITGLNFWGC